MRTLRCFAAGNVPWGEPLAGGDCGASPTPLRSILLPRFSTTRVPRFSTTRAGGTTWPRALAICVLALSACAPARPPAPEGEGVAAPAPTTPGPSIVAAPDDIHPDESASLPAERVLARTDLDEIKPGDIIFHVSRSAQSKAIQLATKSPYSHVGLVESGPDGLVVLEAVQPVKRTPIGEWIARGVDGHFVVKRLKEASELLPPEAALRLRAAGARFLGKHYDTAFGWSDDRIYCSELVYKIYHETLGIEVGPVQRLGDFDLTSPVVKAKLVERYGRSIPLNEPVVSPAGVFDSPRLVTVLER